MNKPQECWVVTDGRAGIENQALGLAEAIGRDAELIITKKTIDVTAPWKLLPRILWGDPFSRLSRSRSLLRPPFPDLWIGCGRLSVPFSMAVKSRSPDTFVVQLQNPHSPLRKFDLVVPPIHDQISGENVFPILGAPNRITNARLKEDAVALAPIMEQLPRPRIAVLVGGSNRANQVGQKQAEAFCSILTDLAMGEVGLMITVSRRTPAFIVERLERLSARENVFYWDGDHYGGLANPYMGILGLADGFIVTGDSVNMACEAGTTGKPVHIYHWSGSGSRGASAKFKLFHDALSQRQVTRPLDNVLDEWTYAPLNETNLAADEVLRRWKAEKP